MKRATHWEVSCADTSNYNPELCLELNLPPPLRHLRFGYSKYALGDR